MWNFTSLVQKPINCTNYGNDWNHQSWMIWSDPLSVLTWSAHPSSIQSHDVTWLVKISWTGNGNIITSSILRGWGTIMAAWNSRIYQKSFYCQTILWARFWSVLMPSVVSFDKNCIFSIFICAFFCMYGQGESTISAFYLKFYSNFYIQKCIKHFTNQYHWLIQE